MKRHIFLYSIITVICSLCLYVLGLHYQEHAKLEIIGEKTTQTAKKTDISNLPESHEIRIKQGSNAKLTKILKAELGDSAGAFQAKTASLSNNQQQATISNSSRPALKANEMSKLFLLLGYFAARKNETIKTNSSIKIQQSDLANNEHNLQAGVAYSYPFLMQLAIKQGNVSAQRAVLRKIKLTNVKKGMQLAKVKHSYLTSKQELKLSTSAADLAKILLNLYRGKIFGRQLDTQALSYLQAGTTAQGGRIYQLRGRHGQAVLVDNGGSSYVWTVLVDDSKPDLNSLADRLNQWYAKN